MQYLKEIDIQSVIQNENAFLVPKFLFKKEFRKISANSKLLFAFIFESKVIKLSDLSECSGFSLELTNKCVKELAGMNLVNIKDSQIFLCH